MLPAQHAPRRCRHRAPPAESQGDEPPSYTEEAEQIAQPRWVNPPPQRVGQLSCSLPFGDETSNNFVVDFIPTVTVERSSH
jgi:hypothetical protein